MALQLSGDALGLGKILQVQSATTATQVDVASTTFTDSGLAVTITPLSTSSLILVLGSQNLFVGVSAAGGADRRCELRLLRDTTEIFFVESATRIMADSYLNKNRSASVASIVHLDSPATTSAVTYKTQIAVDDTANSCSVSAQLANSRSSIVAMEVAA